MPTAQNTILTPNFFNRPVLEVAPDLLGKCLVRNFNQTTAQKKNETGYNNSFLITEVEAYDGPQDKACHAHKGRTKRTEVMFGPAGNWYVYLCYGMHWMLNIVTGPTDYPAAILIRGAQQLLPAEGGKNLLLSGPGKLTKHLSITGNLSTLPATPKTGLHIEDRGVLISPQNIQRTSRIGVSYAGPVWEQKPYRFLLAAETIADLHHSRSRL